MKAALSQPWLAIRNSRPFEGLPDRLLDSILQSGTVRQCFSGELLIGQGDMPEHMFLVLDGQLRTFMTSQDGSEVTLRMLDPGDSCMGVALFMGKLSPVSVDAVGNARILQLPARFLKQLVVQEPVFADNMLRIAAANYRGAIEQIDAMALRTPFQRIGHYLLTEFISTGSEELTFELRFKKSLIASHLGMTPETLSRAFQKMRQSGITVDGSTITLKDAFALCHFCDLSTRESCRNRDSETCSRCRIQS